MKRQFPKKRFFIIVLVLFLLLISIGICKMNRLKIEPVTDISYSTVDLTNEDVTVEFISANKKIVILNNEGKDTYTFTENGSFTFEYKDEKGKKRTKTATVDWIDKQIPFADVSFDILTSTNQNVTATLKEKNEEITIINNEGKDTYTFTENGSFTFEYQDKAGNIGTTTATVDWIDKIAPIALISFSKQENKTDPVTATLILEENESILILNNEGKNYYEFTENGEFEFIYQDMAGNTGKTIARVDWIQDLDRELQEQNLENSEVLEIHDVYLNGEDKEETLKPMPKKEKEEEIKKDENKEDQKSEKKSNKLYIYFFGLNAILILFALKKIKN